LSLALYFLHYLIFRDLHHICIHLISDLAFLPVEVLIVTLIIHKLLDKKERELRLNKMNMVIGVFFSEIGRDMLKEFQEFDQNREELARIYSLSSDWKPGDFDALSGKFSAHALDVDYSLGDLCRLKNVLLQKRKFLLGLLENPNLLEHETFTDLLWAIFHLMEELARRENLKDIPMTDGEHLAGDIKRAYKLLLVEWVSYIKHLKEQYPYLFSLEFRTNPFDKYAKPTVTS
ncbi:MAG: hypothetical protein ACYDFU_04510, partial [Nitrospirota bacterium]